MIASPMIKVVVQVQVVPVVVLRAVCNFKLD